MSDTTINKIRYWLIEILAGDMPVVVNMVIARPMGYLGAIVSFAKPELPGLFTKNILLSEQRIAILSPKRDSEFRDTGI